MSKKIISSLLVLVMIVSILTGLTTGPKLTAGSAEAVNASVSSISAKSPKYIFMFIGDGMSAVQVNSAQIFGGTNEPNNIGLDELNFQKFEAVGYQTTHDSTSFAPDSASTGTALSSGFKTWSGTVGLKPVGNVSGNTAENVDTKAVPKTIAERLKEEKGMKIGIVSTVTINHATPAAYYAHSASRNDYYGIAKQMAESNFDYFGVGTINKATGNDKNVVEKSAYEIMEDNGYKVVNTKEEILALNSKSGKTYAVTPVTQDSGAMPYAIDNQEGDLTLADFVKKGIDVLNNNKGFFMMVEGGKVDWAGHANDAKANIGDVLALEEAVGVALDFQKKYPKDTLIIVTGDHETGGMSIGQATTGYDTALRILEKQKMSYVAFDSLLKGELKNNPDMTFAELMNLVTPNFGLKNEFGDGQGEEPYMGLELSDSEVARLEKALEEAKKEKVEDTEENNLLYGGYNPVSVTLTHILNNKAGIGWTSYSHTGVPVPVYATGARADLFNGAYDNTEVYQKLVTATKLK
ncbi:alkaline phosphatase [Tissierella creatinini]|nr:alkaline phosphatase [Tissierella creatinini]TJX62257.1 alkaline phosphatase [Soehngenia saccharolytica]